MTNTLSDPYDAISNALRLRPDKVPHRATFTHTSPEIFADNKQLDRIDTDNWQIVFGRRGTGKTTILANYGTYLSSSPKDKRIASIEINTNDFKTELTAKSKTLTDREKARIYFAEFVTLIANHLFRVFQDNDPRSKFVRALIELGDRRKKGIEDLIVAIHDSVHLQTGLQSPASPTNRRRLRPVRLRNGTLNLAYPPVQS